MDWKNLLEKNPVKKLAELTAKPKEDKRPEQRRNKLLKLLDELGATHKKGEDKRGVYKRVGDFVQFSPRVGNRKVGVAGEEFGLVPHERFGDFLTGFRAHVESGGYDADIARAFEEGEGKGGTTQAQLERRSAAGKRAPSASRSAAMKAAWERRRAAAAAGGGKK